MSRLFSYCAALAIGVSLVAGCTTRHYHSNDRVMIKTNPAGTSVKVHTKDKAAPGSSHVHLHIKDRS